MISISPRQRKLLQFVVIGGALAGVGGFYAWWATRPYASNAGAETMWRTGGDQRVLSVRVGDDRGLPLDGVIVRAFNNDDPPTPYDDTTGDDGRATVRIGNGRLTRLTINGVNLFERDGWAAPRTDDGLKISVRVVDHTLMRIGRTEDDPAAVAADVAEQLDYLEATLVDPGAEWPMAWRTLVTLREPGWERIERNVFNLTPEMNHLRSMAMFIDPQSRLSGLMDAHYKAALAERLKDETWAIAWARTLLDDENIAAAVSQPWIGYYDNPVDARLDIAFARVAYAKRFGYVWDGDPEEQQAALDRWRGYLDAIDDDEPIDAVVSRRRPTENPQTPRYPDRNGFPGLPRLGEDGRLAPPRIEPPVPPVPPIEPPDVD